MPKSMKALLLSLVLIAYLASSIVAQAQLVGDLNRDHIVDFEDLRLLTEHWLDPNCLIPGCDADLDGSDGVGMVDFALLAENWQAKGRTLIISEFLALNGSNLPLEQGELLDEDGDSSDWIEIYNTTGASINLNGWCLTNDVDDLAIWEFPPVQLGPGEFKIIFASEKDRDDPDGELHTNFRISGSAGFLALVKPDRTTIVHSYEYPQQFGDISYGIADPNGVMFATEVLVPEYTDAKAFIPQDDSLGMDWTEIDFNDSGWLEGQTGVGYDYGSLIGLNVSAMRYNNETVYIRIPFEVNNVSNLEGLKLRMKFEDGFAAYINNNQLIVSDNAPNNLQWYSGALDKRDDNIAVNFKDFPLPDDYIDYIQIGSNILAIHGLNKDLDSTDLLILPKLEINRTGTIDFSSVIEGYFFTPTPGALNGASTVNFGPAIRNVTQNTPQPADDNDLIITTEISETFNSIQTVRLHYRIMYGSEVDFLMVDDGLHGDGDPADGVYGAVIPASASAPGEMIRWYVTAEDVNNRASRNPMFPYPDNSPEYYGTVVKDPTVNTQLPVIEWFVENVAASETDSGTRGSVYYLGEFYDNIVIHRRGGSTASNGWNDKKHFKFNFNRGYKFKFDPDKSRVNEFNLNCTYSDKAYLRQNLAFEAYDWCGCPSSISFPVRAQRNGQFRGVYIFIEEPEEELLEREGLDPDGALYKMYNTFTGPGEKKTRRWEGTADISNFISSINNTSGTILHNNIFDQVDLPLTLNYLVATIITHQNDHPHKNHYLYRDSDGSGEWFFLPWDHDLTWGSNWTGSSYHDYIYADDDQVSGKPTDVKPSHPFVGKQDCKEWNYHWNNLIDALFEDVTVRQMYLRRLRTVMDELLKPPGTPYDELSIENRIDELVAQMAPDVALDYAQYPWEWGGQDGYPIDQSFEYAINVIKNDYLAVRRYHLFVTHNIDNAGSYNIVGSYSALIPNAQPASPTINFGSYEYNPASHNQDEEYIELINPNSYAVDISGYKLTGAVEHTFLPGTVIVNGSSLYVSPNVRTFRARSTSPTGGEGNFVQGNYRGHLSSWGETINLLDSDETLVNTITYVGNPSDQQRYLRITEVMYHPVDANEGSPYNDEEFEYIELKNIGSAPLLLDGIKFTKGVYFTFPGISLAGGKYLLVVKNQAAFTLRYTVPGDVQIIGPYDGQLSNAGEDVKLEDLTNSTILEFDYSDEWFSITDGIGFSLTIRDANDPNLDNWDRKKGWRTSAYIGGSPGWDDSGILPDPGAVVINEVMAHSHVGPDWIELHNTTDEEINIGGWFLSDNDRDEPNLTKYRIADGTTIPSNGYKVFYQDANFSNPGDPGCLVPFVLSENGEETCLSSRLDPNGMLTGYRDVENFGASQTNVSFGRYFKSSTGNFNFVAMDHNTPGYSNANPKVGPIVINEIMYNPPTGNQNEEYIELHNITAAPVTLYRTDKLMPWKFTDGIDYTFSASELVTIPADSYLMIVKDLPAFITRYGSMPGGVQVLDGYDGFLSNGGERLQIAMPGDIDEEGTRYYIRIDRVTYSDGSHPEDCPGGIDLWPTEADGLGKSLSRKVSSAYGNDVANWKAATPSPGVANP